MSDWLFVTPQYEVVIPVTDEGQGPLEYQADVIEIEAENSSDAIVLGEMLGRHLERDLRTGAPPMTDRINGFIVTLEKDIRIDEAEITLEAIRHIKGVLGVTPNVSDLNAAIAHQRIRSEVVDKLIKLVKEL